jgi:hypothetical protein
LGSRRKPGEIKYNGTHQLVVYADDEEDLLIASEATGLEPNAKQTKVLVHLSLTACRPSAQHGSS